VTVTSDTTSSSSSRTIAWLLTYPGSGEDYIKELIQEVSQTSMATNYGFEVYPHPSVSSSVNGPYRIRTDLPLPSDIVLTESHCTGYCLSCPDTLATGDWRQFYVRCGSGNFFDAYSSNEARYKTEGVSKLLHLIRDPFDTVISRFYADYEAATDGADRHWKYNLDRQGFKEWCDDFNAGIQAEDGTWLLEHIPPQLGGVPCHGLFYQYVLWHNNVAEVMGSLGWRMSEYHVRYEDVKDDKEALFDLFQFLGLPIQGLVPAAPKEPFTQQDYFLDSERIAISSLLKVIACRTVWSEIADYLPAPQMQDIYSPIGSHLAPQTYGSWPKLAWLLSFPFSGTDFTIRSVEKLSRVTTATNYAADTGDNYHVYPNVAYTTAGPFRRSDRPFPENYILVKTQCEVCTYCDPRHKITYSEFIEGCSRTRSSYNVLGHYDPALIHKIIHIVRNPFDNIVFTFRNRYKKAKQNLDNDFQNTYQYAPEGFKNWCRHLDSRFNTINPAFTGELAAAAQNIPCYGILFQYVQWHNHAHRVCAQMDVPSIVIRYEDYQAQLTNTMNTIFDFVQHPHPNNVEEILLQDEFLADSILEPATNYYTQEEKLAAGIFVQKLATPDAYKTLQVYF
jgi:hypothetical protein